MVLTQIGHQLRSFANMKLQLPHHRGSYGISSCTSSAIPAFYASTASLVRWLGHHSNDKQDLTNLAGVWAPGQDMSNDPDSWTAPGHDMSNDPDSWTASALTCAHALLLAGYECIEWGPAAGPASSAARTLLIRRIRLQVAPIPANFPQRYRRWFYPHYLCSLRVVREKADTTAVRRRSSMTVIVLPQTRVSA